MGLLYIRTILCKPYISIMYDRAPIELNVAYPTASYNGNNVILCTFNNHQILTIIMLLLCGADAADGGPPLEQHLVPAMHLPSAPSIALE